jgi:hypothetical protein
MHSGDNLDHFDHADCSHPTPQTEGVLGVITRGQGNHLLQEVL